MTKDWTIEATYLQPAKDLYWNELPEGIAPDDMVGLARGRMTDGRVFQYITYFTKANFDAIGEDRALQDLRDSAIPPEAKVG